MDKVYDHGKHEEDIYKLWEDKGLFTSKDKPPFYTILMPPPNANGSLHAGHAMYTIDDILIRFKRMEGYSVLWLPGMDHAGFETQYVYEKELSKKGASRMDYDRETLYKNIYEFVNKNSGLIYSQFKRLGFSADWDKSVFTLDKKVVDFVYKTFIKMEKEGYIYRDGYIVNYCTHCGTSLADLEVKHVTRNTPLYYIKYGPLTLATVRPETKFADTALAVNPDDKRYKSFIGKSISADGLLGKLTFNVIADSYVDPDFGTGVVKITPYHDPNDYDVWMRHKEEMPEPFSVIDITGRLTKLAGKYEGMKVAQAREKIVEDLKRKGLIEKIDEEYEHSVTVCYKCGRELEPLVVPNWFIKVNKLKNNVKKAVLANKINFYPKRYKKHMLTWLDVMHDWPISRQIAWGIRIPVWYDVSKNPDLSVSFLTKDKKTVSGKISKLLVTYKLDEISNGLQTLVADKISIYKVSVKNPGKGFLQETDTFDTWFSSGQWPLVTIPENEMQERFPTDVMATLSDILRFWVSRMILFSLYITDKVPFKNVYLWSMVADSKGQKMSKSRGNVINPIVLIDKYGADALRMSLVYGGASGSKVILAEDKVRGMRNFANKLWNIARFISMEEFDKKTPYPKTDNIDDLHILGKLNDLIETVTGKYDSYRFNEASALIYDFIWHELADSYLEKVKSRRVDAQPTLTYVLKNTLCLLHPIMPFVTERIYQDTFASDKNDLIALLPWPKKKIL